MYIFRSVHVSNKASVDKSFIHMTNSYEKLIYLLMVGYEYVGLTKYRIEQIQILIMRQNMHIQKTLSISPI